MKMLVACATWFISTIFYSPDVHAENWQPIPNGKACVDVDSIRRDGATLIWVEDSSCGVPFPIPVRLKADCTQDFSKPTTIYINSDKKGTQVAAESPFAAEASYLCSRKT